MRTRPTKTEYYLEIAHAVAARSTCNRRQYGAVIVKGDVIVSTGYNGSARDFPNCCETDFCARKDKPHNSGYDSSCPAVHAEMNAIINGNHSDLAGSTLYLYGSYYDEAGKEHRIDKAVPCEMCMRAVRNARIAKIVNYSHLSEREFDE